MIILRNGGMAAHYLRRILAKMADGMSPIDGVLAHVPEDLQANAEFVGSRAYGGIFWRLAVTQRGGGQPPETGQVVVVLGPPDYEQPPGAVYHDDGHRLNHGLTHGCLTSPFWVSAEPRNSFAASAAGKMQG